MRLGCKGYGQDGTGSLRDDTVRDMGREMRRHHRSLTDPQDDHLGFVLLGILNYRVRDLATVCDRANRRIDGCATLGGDLLQGLGHNLRNDMTPVTAFERPRKHMQAMEGRSGRFAEKCRITNGTGRFEVEGRREDNWAAKLARLGSVGCLRPNGQYRAKLCEGLLQQLSRRRGVQNDEGHSYRGWQDRSLSK